MKNKHRGHKKLRDSAFSLRTRVKTERKYFTSEKRITSIVIFYTQPKTPIHPISQITNYQEY